jgi:Fe-S-cluster containining protein
MDLSSLKLQAKNAEPVNKKLFAKIKKTKPKNLDQTMQKLHDEVFEKINCLECANCCKTTSPIFYQKDIEKLAKHFRLSPSKFIEQYLHIDEDKDYVLNQAPCPFLGTDNYCSVYEFRPNACREYPHTDRKRFHQILDLTIKNTSVCPAVFQIVEKMKILF